MRNVLSRIVVALAIVAVATPAYAAGREEAGGYDAGAVAVTAARAVEAPAGGNASLRQAAQKAGASLAGDQRVGGPVQTSPRTPRGVRAQMGGGGKGAMVMGIVYTVVGLAGTVYMYKMIQDRSKEDDAQ